MYESSKTSLFDGAGNETERRAAVRAAAAFLPEQHQSLARQALSGDAATFGALETAVLQRAQAAAHNSGRLVAFQHRDDAGRKVTTYEGDPWAWMEPYALAGKRARVDLDKARGMRTETVKVGPGQRIRVE